LGLIGLYLRLILRAGTGFRGAAATLKLLAGLFPTGEAAPSANGGQMWLLRWGLFELSRPKEFADDWVWMADHTLQTGRGKCFVVVGVRLGAWAAKRADPKRPAALEHEDLSVWMIEPVAKSDGPTVAAQLEELSRRTGVVPREILSDCGGDLQSGIARFRAEHPRTAARKDIAHAAANAVKRELNGNATWEAFLRDANRAKTKLRQTPGAFLLPPELKAKARWMNLDALLRWSRRAAAFVAAPRPVPGVPWGAAEWEEAMGWLRGYAPPLAAWSEMLEVTATSLKYVREHGFHARAQEELARELTPWRGGKDTPASRVAATLLAFVGEQSSDLLAGERLLGSSEVLESLIGKAKHLEGQQSRSGFTKMILGIAASVREITEEALHAALEAVKVRDVRGWIEQQLGISVQGQRMHAFAPQALGTEPG
jgi:hypothetical protein